MVGRDIIGDVETHARLEGAGIEILAQRGDGGIGVGGGNAGIFHRAGQRVAGIQRDGAGFDARRGIGFGLVLGFRRGELGRDGGQLLAAAGAHQLEEQFIGQGGAAWRRRQRPGTGKVPIAIQAMAPATRMVSEAETSAQRPSVVASPAPGRLRAVAEEIARDWRRSAGPRRFLSFGSGDAPDPSPIEPAPANRPACDHYD